MQEGELQAEWLVRGVADFCGYPEQRMDNATLIAGIRFVALCIIILSLCMIELSWTSTACRDTGQCIGDGTNADLTILHSALAIISEPAIKLDNKITQVLCEQTTRISWETTKYALYCKATDNVGASIKFQKFLQPFAVFLAKCL